MKKKCLNALSRRRDTQLQRGICCIIFLASFRRLAGVALGSDPLHGWKWNGYLLRLGYMCLLPQRDRWLLVRRWPRFEPYF